MPPYVSNPDRISTKWEDPSGRINIRNMMGNLINTLGTSASSLLTATGENWGDYIFWNSNTNTWDVGDTKISLGANSGHTGQGDFAIALGNEAGEVNQGINSIALGTSSGQVNQGSNSISLGQSSGQFNQGANSIAIGSFSGQTNQAANSIVINANGTSLDGPSSGLFIDPIAIIAGTGASQPYLKYDLVSKQVAFQLYNSIPLETVSLIFGGGPYVIDSGRFYLYEPVFPQGVTLNVNGSTGRGLFTYVFNTHSSAITVNGISVGSGKVVCLYTRTDGDHHVVQVFNT